MSERALLMYAIFNDELDVRNVTQPGDEGYPLDPVEIEKGGLRMVKIVEYGTGGTTREHTSVRPEVRTLIEGINTALQRSEILNQ